MDSTPNSDSQRSRFLVLIEQYEPALRRLTGSYVNSPAEFEDLFQEIAMALWTALPRFRGDSSERTWLYRIAHNVASTFVAAARRRSAREQSPASALEEVPDRQNVEQAAILGQEQRRLQKLIQELSLPDQQLVLLYLEGLSAASIAEISGLSAVNVATKLTRIRQRLAEEIRMEASHS